MSLQDLSPSEIYLLSILYELGQADIYEFWIASPRKRIGDIQRC